MKLEKYESLMNEAVSNKVGTVNFTKSLVSALIDRANTIGTNEHDVSVATLDAIIQTYCDLNEDTTFGYSAEPNQFYLIAKINGIDNFIVSPTSLF